MKKLTFKEYWESKEQLLEASYSVPTLTISYTIKKYCKLPVIAESSKDSIALKPKDTLSIIWEYHDLKRPEVKTIIFNDNNYLPYWEASKIRRWIDSTGFEKNNHV